MFNPLNLIPVLFFLGMWLAFPIAVAKPPASSTAPETLPPDPKNVLNRMASVKPPGAAPSGQALSIGYWSYRIYGQYCVEPKVYTCGNTNLAMSWVASTPPTIELVDSSGVSIHSYTLPSVLPAAMLNYKGVPSSLGAGLSPGSLVQWCAVASNWPVWRLKIGNSVQRIEWNPSADKRRTSSPTENPC